MKKAIIMILIIHALAAVAVAKEPVTYDPALPNVLIIGDSISIGYYHYVAPALAPVANVFRINPNAGNTEKGMLYLDQWLTYTMLDGTVIDKWSVIHFNFGLHDIRRGSREWVELPKYIENLEVMTKKMLLTGATLIFATSTFFTWCCEGRLNSDIVLYNEAAVSLMQYYSIGVNDLYSLSSCFPALLYIADCDVHPNRYGRKILADKVSLSIANALKIRGLK